MKKFLIASTALTLSAGVAAADVTFSGDARFGVMYNSDATVGDANWNGATGNDSKTRLEKRYSLNIDASTTADNGVTFGARVRLRNEERSNAAATGGNTMGAGARLFARYQGFEVAVGNVLGAIEQAPNAYSRGTSLTGLSWGSVVFNVDRAVRDDAGVVTTTFRTFDWDAYSSGGSGAEGVEVLYSAGDFKGHLTYSHDDLRGINGTAKRLAAWGSYNFSGWTAALGFQDSNLDWQDKFFVSFDGKIQDFGVGFAAAQNGKGNNKVNKYVLNGSYTMGATTIAAYVANQSEAPDARRATTTETSKTSYGLGASYNLGGGASIVGGVERTTQKTTRADLGVSFRF
ncbi:porin [Falsigemmobacter faecalis]|uniref:Porin n=1 Tax=Falsigemmobacter faecalis TaxID=2488730 RepID=A0A3P3DPC1_9RHOB|nr:porin [Falsigemmobacter faecalis]RRH75546.1 porin [Falsigemmobacter faecalis]